MQRLFADTSLVSWKQSSPGEKEVHPGADLWKISCSRNGSEMYHTLREGMTPEEYGIGKAPGRFIRVPWDW